MEPLQPYLVFLIPITVGIITQIIKFALFTLKHGWQPEYIFTHGHMPSMHTAFAVSVMVSVGYFEGLHSGSFAVSVLLSFLIIDDALRIRMILGDQGRYFNMLVEQLRGTIDEAKFPRLKERIGHRVSEVVGGAIVGLVLTLLFIYLFS
ncbi:MAG: divergent PAP2 family protein [Patescibacteria group bacterium]